APTEDAALHACQMFASGTSGSPEDKATAAARASKIMRARGEFERALDFLTPLQRTAWISAEIGNVFFDLGDHVLADLYYEEAILAGLEPEGDLRARMATSAHWYAESLLYDSESPDRAIESYGRALAFDPEHVPSLQGRAEANHALGRHQEALADLDRAIAIEID